MGYKIKEIVLDSELFSRYEVISPDKGDAKKFGKLSKINILIGTNNSGKSRFLRYIFGNQFQFYPSLFDLSELNQIISECQHGLQKIFDDHRLTKYGDIESNSPNYQLLSPISPNSEFVKPFLAGVNKLANAQVNADFTLSGLRSTNINTEVVSKKLNELGENTHSKLRQIFTDLDPNLAYSFEKIYIPTLRGLRKITTRDQEDPYRKKTFDDYFEKSGNAKSNIFTGYELNNKVKELLLGTLAERSLIAGFQEYLSNKFFSQKPVALLPSLKDETLRIKIGDEEEKPIHELGDGIQSIIILTFPLFINKGQNLLVFIEEPELFLHPGLQRIFIETLLDPLFDNFQYFIATHSNHFLDITLDVDQISIYTFKKFFKDETGEEKPAYFQIENVNNEDTNVLDLIGVRNSSVFLSNCTIWVEGITDRYYFRKYLQVYQNGLPDSKPRFWEDTHYSFVEYSGGNITHWSFLDEEETDEAHSTINIDRVCNRIFLVADQDEGKEKRHEKLREKLGDQYYCLKCREVESLLKADVLKRVIAEYEKKDFSQLEFKVDLIEKEYRDVYLGRFIDDNLIAKARRGSYSSESGTISDKVNFCKKAIGHIDNVDDLSQEARELCEKIYIFIDKNNNQPNQ